MKKTACLIAFALLLFSCRDEKSAANTDDTQARTKIQNVAQIDEFMRRGPDFPVGNSLAEIRKNFGEPLRQSAADRQNIHNPNQTDKIHKLSYEGLYLEVYHVEETNRDILLLLEVTGDRYPIAFGLNIGRGKAAVRAALGAPNEERPDRWRYFASDLIMGAFDFAFQNDRLVSITWHYAID